MLLSCVCSYAQTITTYSLSEAPITKEELLKGNLKVALRVWTTSKDLYLSNANNSNAFDANGSTVFAVEAVKGGVKLKNVKSNEYFGGEGAALARTADAAKAKVFSPVKIGSKVANTHADADETRSFWITCQPAAPSISTPTPAITLPCSMRAAMATGRPSISIRSARSR